MNKLAIFFSTGGVTRRMVEYMGIPSVEIKAQQPYTDADILSVNPKARVNVEQDNKKLRVPTENFKDTREVVTKAMEIGFGEHTEIYLGFPLWNLYAPRLIFSVLDICKELFKNNTINVFCTSGGSAITQAERELKQTYPCLKWGKFKQFSYTSTKDEVRRWAEC